MLKVQLFAQARQLVGSPVVELPCSDGDSVSKLKRQLTDRYPGLRPLASNLLVAVNHEYADDDAVVKLTDEVACFPPVSGG